MEVGVGSTAVFNLWIKLTQARLDDSSPLTPQLAKLDEACVKLSNMNMGVSDIQYCFILFNVLLKSYEIVTSTLLTSGLATALKFSEITACILNKEGRKSRPLTSLNSVALIKTGKGKKKKDDSDAYCSTTPTQPPQAPQKVWAYTPDQFNIKCHKVP